MFTVMKMVSFHRTVPVLSSLLLLLANERSFALMWETFCEYNSIFGTLLTIPLFSTNHSSKQLVAVGTG